MKNILTVFRRSFDFSGRSQRTEFWSFFLFVFGLAMVFLAVSLVMYPDEHSTRHASDLLGKLWLGLCAVVIVPHTAATVRRLHDINRSGWWLLLSGFGFVVGLLLYWLMRDGTPGENDYGPDPKGREAYDPYIPPPRPRVAPAAMPRL